MSAKKTQKAASPLPDWFTPGRKNAAFQLLVAMGVILVILGIGMLFENSVNAYILRIIVNCGIAILLSLSLNLVNGCAGQFSLGHAGFMAVGAYTSAAITVLLGEHVPWMRGAFGVGIATVVGGVMAAVAGWLVGLPSLRLRGDYLAIVTLGFGEIIRIVFLNVEVLGGARGLPGIPRESSFFWVYLWAAITFVAIYRLIYSSHGRAILAVREDEVSASAMGINTSRHKVVAFVVSSFFAGIAGALFAHYQGFIDPSGFNFQRSVDVVIMVVLGGMGSLSGAILGALVVTALPEMLRVFEQYRLVIFPALLVILMLVRPMGVFGRREIWEIVRELPKNWKALKMRRRHG